jgi:hypothetical protein
VNYWCVEDAHPRSAAVRLIKKNSKSDAKLNTTSNVEISVKEAVKEKPAPLPRSYPSQDPSSSLLKFAVLPGNNSRLVKKVIKLRSGWTSTEEFDSLFNLKWKQTAHGIRYENMNKDPKHIQLANHYEKNGELTTKSGLLRNMWALYDKMGKNVFEVLPVTFAIAKGLDDPEFVAFRTNFLAIAEANAKKGANGAKRKKRKAPKLIEKCTSASAEMQDTIPTQPEGTTSPTLLEAERPLSTVSSNSNSNSLSITDDSNDMDCDEGSGSGPLLPPLPTSLTAAHPVPPEKEKEKSPSGASKQKQVALDRLYGVKRVYHDRSVPPEDSPLNVWIIKPTGKNRGKGIEVMNTLEGITSLIDNFHRSGQSCVIQKYMERPLLIHNRKFDIRLYALLTPELDIYYYPVGYIRTSGVEYVLSRQSLADRSIHLTNNAVQRKSETYGAYEEGNQLSYPMFQDYLDAEYPEAKINVESDLCPVFRRLVLHSLYSVRHLVNPFKRKYCFELFGYDFMLDSKFNVSLIEVNTNPCLDESSSILKELLPKMLDDCLKLCVDPYFPSKASKRLKDPESKEPNGFELLLKGSDKLEGKY